MASILLAPWIACLLASFLPSFIQVLPIYKKDLESLLGLLAKNSVKRMHSVLQKV